MSQALRKLTATISKSGSVLVFINQIRMKIGVMFGNPETTTGGNALKFYASIRLDVRKVETINKGQDEAIGNLVRVKVVKNKVAPPFKKAEVEILFGQGISYYGSLLDCALKYELVQKSGSWFSFGEERIGQGRDNAREFLQKNPAIAKTLEEKLRKTIFPDRDIPGSKPLGTVNDKIASDAAVVRAAAEPAKVSKVPAKAVAAGEEGGSELF
jgi:recombination protein RecA